MGIDMFKLPRSAAKEKLRELLASTDLLEQQLLYLRALCKQVAEAETLAVIRQRSPLSVPVPVLS
jgi:hypothetical protein